MMLLIFKLFATLLGLLVGFTAGLFAVMHITGGENIKAVLADKEKKIWLGLLAWGFALVGAWLGWQVAEWVIYANR